MLASALLFGHIYESFAIRPHYLASFNALAGGPSRAYRLVSDSSLDWGQDLLELRRWLDNERHARAESEPIYVAYFGSGDPGRSGIRATFLPS